MKFKLLDIALYLTLVIIVSMHPLNGLTQCISGEIYADSFSACKDENILLSFTNNSNNYEYEWDFCQGAFKNTPNPLSISTISSSGPFSLKLVESDSSIYGYLSSRNSNQLIILDFENGIDQTPILRQVTTSFPNIYGFDIYENEEGIFGIVTTQNGKIFLVQFDNYNDITPQVSEIVNPFSLNDLRGVKIVYDNENYYAFIAASSKLLRIDFGNSFTNNPILNEMTVSGGVFLSGLDLIKVCDQWKGLITGYSSGVHLLEFNSGIDNNPTSSLISGAGKSINDLQIVKDSTNIYAILPTDNNGELVTLDFGLDLNNSPVSNNLGNFGILANPYAFDVIKKNGKYNNLIVNFNNRKLSNIQFSTNCQSNLYYSFDEKPIIRFNESGNYTINLQIKDNLGRKIYRSQNFEINDDLAPQIEFSVGDNSCITSPIQFNSTSIANINAYEWDFGDGNTSTVENPSHTYAAAGTYAIKLQVTDANGCQNLVIDSVSVFEEPVPDFQVTSQGSICSQKSIHFENLANLPTEAIFSWDFGDGNSSSEENPEHIYGEAGEYTVRQTIVMSGCLVEKTKDIIVSPGPLVNFEIDNNCIGENIQFTNQSTGTNITSYAWDFGNGETSTEENPITNYPDPGEYEVTLTVSNASGCENVNAKTIMVYEQVIDSILITEAIENLPFIASIDWLDSFDSTQNLSYQWIVNGNTQTNETAEFTLAAGDYELQLQVTTASGCVFNKASNITVKASEFPTADFASLSEACINERVIIENFSINAESYEWDFCIGDFDSTAVLANSIAFNANSSKGMELVYHNNSYFGFVIKGSNLVRLDFGSSLLSTPTIVDLGDLNGALLNPEAIVIKENYNGNWIAFIGHLDVDYGITRVNFGDDITNDFPTYENIGVLNPGRTRGLDLVEDNGNYFLLASGYNNNRFAILKLTGSLEASFDSNDINIYGPYSELGLPTGITTISYNDNWLVYIVSQGNGNLTRFNFGNSFDNTPLIEENYSLGLESAKKIRLFNELDRYYAIIGSDTSPITVWDLNTLSSSSVSKINQPNLPSNFSFSFSNRPTGRFLNVISSNNFQSILFEAECSAIIHSSSIQNPTISFSQPGTYPITLTAYHPNGNSESITKEITVTENQAPEIAFAAGEDLCVSAPIQFSSESNTEISSYSWDFGDGNTSSEANPAHLFSSAGEYLVQLSVSDTAGCNNLFQDSITIYAEPVPDFQASAQGSICSQKPVVFENITTLPTTATFQWDFGDGTTSTEENPEHIYASEGEYIIHFQIEMAGCLVEKSDTITVNPGPLVDFNYSDDCFGQVVNFENSSTGDFLQSFQWDFGDGTQSTQTSPNHRYDSAGTYKVQLTALTSNGCDYTFEQEVIVHPVATVAFESEVACANRAVQFNEQVTLQQSNVTDYLWDFGVSGTTSDSSTEANPEFTFPTAGTYEVSLQVTTADGCTTSGTQTVSVNALPQPAFTYEDNCLTNTILFSPASTENIIAHFWELKNTSGDVVFTAQSETFSYAFENAGTYELRYRQENENLCSNSITETIEILPLPEPDFQLGNICANEAIFFENLTDLKGNTLKTYEWSINGSVVSTDFKPQYTFEESGDYQVGLQVETQNGCIQTVEKTITVSPSPEAFFELEQSLAAYPYALSLSPQDYPLEGIIGVSWILNNDTISSNAELNHTIEQPGTYLLGLILTNEAGCTDSHYEQIRIREPNLDIALSNLRITQDQDFTGFVLNISNRGTLVPERLDLEIDLGSYSVTETIEEPLLPERNRNVALSIKLTEEQIRGLAKICIRAVPHNAAANESNENNNRLCTNIESGLNIMEIYPNPASTNFTLPMIIPENASVNLNLERSNGKSVKAYSYDLEAGYNEIQIDRGNIKAGIYFLRIRYQGEEKVKKIIFQ